MRNLLFWEVDEPNDLTRSIDAFTFEMLPYFTNAFDRGEHKDFFVAALPLFSDRFPTASSEQKRLFAKELIYQDGMTLLGGNVDPPAPFDGNWREAITLEADRERRRSYWRQHGEGDPIEHQYIIAFATIDGATDSYSQL
ncbi:hypothetical protein PC9H_000047 [Pleurotus ostreatus]|uniref:Uncharacterized protein n=2 Tax=Pleurotus ostreatus TaxID=5322 RepID=A0A067NEI1_PLEO1|nr:uncharacterized protein PC9H_004365 [Pleurotus ostreatus]XP_036635555.1 uncharacterized protein PC9H_000047 [Pleurotus ostreatus]KDQ22196.1 hypothetical protein PLEOSDRAFT_1109314 [Pleurotus ostreatus PC15]KAF7437523.1 hypothetical protein PC9H_004365 [Pleurotus ostreatus]KAF7439711.1 hypothetical protein PC9H_000047 [Pleurotus ostreatus]KAJ8701132.1 hypothetical protein PTI98_004089 [Pleurotus ostreatus]KAJ8703471.1 hypothetical protein PTI98_002093 [Pleurotus ostreatus]